MTQHNNPDIAWLVSTPDAKVLAQDLNRVAAAIKDTFNLPLGLASLPYKNIALRRAHDMIQH